MPLTQHPTAIVHQAEAAVTTTNCLYPESMNTTTTNDPKPPKNEMVGSLLVPQQDVQELSTKEHNGSDNTTTKSVHLAKRLTERITDDVQTKPDDFNPWSNQKDE